MDMEEIKHLLPPFTLESALQKVQMAEDAWNSRDPERVSLAYTTDTEWRNRIEMGFSGRSYSSAGRSKKQKGNYNHPGFLFLKTNLK
jgi:uncharacterized protein